MKEAVFVNFMIVCLIALVIIQSSNALALLGLLMLRELPYGLLTQDENVEEPAPNEYGERKIGFHSE